MKLRKFNESHFTEKDAIETIKESFYLITDKHPLDIDLKVYRGFDDFQIGIFYVIELNFEHTFISFGKYRDLNELNRNLKTYNDLIKDYNVIINNLKKDFEIIEIIPELDNSPSNLNKIVIKLLLNNYEA